jgi:hypothetical protein
VKILFVNSATATQYTDADELIADDIRKETCEPQLGILSLAAVLELQAAGIGLVVLRRFPRIVAVSDADSFAMMRGGHLDFCVLGAFQVSATGDLANWHTGAPDAIPAVGGAMDLAIGAKKTYVMMEHVTKGGEMKMSAPSVVSNQSDTVVRKLPIMTLTPTITLTAIVSAATAIEVRLRERVTARGAIRPNTPKMRDVNGEATRIMIINTMGVKSALPITMQNNAPKLT